MRSTPRLKRSLDRLRDAIRASTVKLAEEVWSDPSDAELEATLMGAGAGGLGTVMGLSAAGDNFSRAMRTVPTDLELSPAMIDKLQSQLGFKEQMPVRTTNLPTAFSHVGPKETSSALGEISQAYYGPEEYVGGRKGTGGSAVVLGPGGYRSTDVLAHELGHATAAQKGTTLTRRAIRRLYGAGLPGAVLATGAVPFIDSESNWKYAPLAAGAAIQAPQLIEEAIATKRGLKAMEGAGAGEAAMKAARRRMRAAYATYGAKALGLASIPALALYAKENWVNP